MVTSDLALETTASMTLPAPKPGPARGRVLAGFLAGLAGVLMLGGLLAGCGSKTTPLNGGGNTPPTDLPKAHIQPLPPQGVPAGTISASSLLALAGDTLTFDPSGSSPLADLVKFVWDFRYDGLTLTSDFLSNSADIVTTSYQFPGTYTIALQVTDKDGRTDLTTFKVFVGDPGATLQLIPSSLDFGTPKVGDTVDSVVYVFNSGAKTVNITGVTSDRPEVIPGTLPAILPVNAAEAVPIPVDFLSFTTDTLTGNLLVHVDGLPDMFLGYTGTAQSGFARVGPMNVARKFHTATRLADGRVLIVGGEDSANRVLDSVEIYDPDTRTFLPGPSLSDVAQPEPGVPVIGPRSHHTATLLADGTVLVAGGDYVDGTTGNVRVHATGVVFDPSRDEWTYNFRLANPRTQHTAVRVVTAGGEERVLLIGGKEDPTAVDGLDTVEILHGSGAFVGTGILAEPRILHAAVALDNHRVLIAGGRGQIGGAPNWAADGAEIFDLDTYASSVVPMAVPAYELTLTRVDSGTGSSALLATGGGQLTLGALASVQSYAPTEFTVRLGRLADPRRRHVAVDLGGGRGLLVVGGIGPTNLALDRAEIVAADGSAVIPVADRMAVPRGGGHRATLLDDGSVLVTGGVAPGLGGAVNTAELYIPDP
jgi:Kelch motif/PKD domain/Galactose oxidase, central domain